MGMRYRRRNRANHDAPCHPVVQITALSLSPIGWIVLFAISLGTGSLVSGFIVYLLLYAAAIVLASHSS